MFGGMYVCMYVYIYMVRTPDPVNMICFGGQQVRRVDAAPDCPRSRSQRSAEANGYRNTCRPLHDGKTLTVWPIRRL